MSTLTLSEAIDRYGVDVDAHLDRQANIPVATRLARQGDVLVLAAGPPPTTTAVPVPATGWAVVRGEAGGNTHLLIADGMVTFTEDTPTATSLRLGTFTVEDGATAWLTHPEHGYIGFAPGHYEVRRQREQAEELRLVAD